MFLLSHIFLFCKLVFSFRKFRKIPFFLVYKVVVLVNCQFHDFVQHLVFKIQNSTSLDLQSSIFHQVPESSARIVIATFESSPTLVPCAISYLANKRTLLWQSVRKCHYGFNFYFYLLMMSKGSSTTITAVLSSISHKLITPRCLISSPDHVVYKEKCIYLKSSDQYDL